MALSNWSTVALSHEGIPTNGIFTSAMGVMVSVYKNWLFVSDERAWRVGTYNHPLVAEVQHGSLRYHDVCLQAWRGPQGGVFAAVWSGYGEAFHGMIACGTEAHDNAGNASGVSPESLLWFRKLLAEDEHDVPLSLAWALVFCEPVCFNQGDAFFSAQVGVPVPTARPGEAGPTVMSMLLDRVVGR